MIIEQHLKDKRQELVWALSLQDYKDAEIGRIFNMSRVAIKRITDNMPKDYKVKWVKTN